jgi:hypothetical protein
VCSLKPISLVLALAIAGCGGSNDAVDPPRPAAPLAQTETRPFVEQGFRTAVPRGWHRRLVKRDGERLHFLNSGRGHANDFGLAQPGEVGLTIARQQVPRDASARGQLARIAATPDGAFGVTRSRPIESASLDGAQAATTQFTYTYEGRSFVQSNVVAIYRGVLVFIEVDVEPPRAADGDQVMATVRRAWRWTRPEDVVTS